MLGPSLGRLLREHRSGVGWTIEELAHRAGVSPRTVSDLERDRVRRPQRRTLTAVLDALGLAAAERDLVRRTAGVDRPPPGPCPMPEPPPHFTGRRDARDAIRALAGADTDGPAAVAVVTGQPGVGKTALALHVARELAAGYPDGRFFIDLRGTQPFPATPAEALRRLLVALGVAEGRIPAGLDERARVYRGLLRHRRVLLVLDNAATEDQVRPLLPGDGPGLLLEPLPPDDAAALLHAVGGPHAGDAPEPLAVLAAHCGHLPLALRVAGQRLHDEPGLSVPALNGRLARARDRIAVLDGGVPGVAAALRLSYRSLPPAGRRTLRRLALIPGPDFTADAAAAVCGADPAAAEDELDALVECGLLTIRPPDRYGLHDLVRDFAATCLRGDEPDGGRAASDTVVRWLLETTVRAGRHFEPSGPDPDPGAVSPAFTDAAPARAWLDANLDNWLPALRTAAETGVDDLVVAVADALHWFSDHRLHLGIWAEVFRLGAEAAVRTGDVAVQAVHLNHLAWAQAICEGDYRACLGTAGEALRCAEAAGDVAQQGWALMGAASARTALGEHGAALRLRQRAWVALRKAGDREGVPQAMRLLGSSLAALGRAEEALRVHLATLRLLRDPGYPMASFAKAVSDALTCGAIGTDLAVAGRWPEGVEAFREALAGMRATELRTQEPGVLIGLADALRHTGAVTEAAGHLAVAAELARDLGDAETAARAGAMLAGLAPD